MLEQREYYLRPIEHECYSVVMFRIAYRMIELDRKRNKHDYKYDRHEAVRKLMWRTAVDFPSLESAISVYASYMCSGMSCSDLRKFICEHRGRRPRR